MGCCHVLVATHSHVDVRMANDLCATETEKGAYKKMSVDDLEVDYCPICGGDMIEDEFGIPVCDVCGYEEKES